jgi:CDP-glucose 4,6-dehydratase
MHYLITGHTGFKGSWLSLMLQMQGHTVSGISLHSMEKSLFNQANLNHIFQNDFRIDIRDSDSLSRAVKNIDPEVLIHLAAQPLVRESYKDPIRTFETNVMGTLNVLEATKRLKNLRATLIVTTDKVYKNKNDLRGYVESDPLGGDDPYSASKAAADLATQSWVKSFAASPVAIARAGNVIGGGDFAADRIIPDLVKAYSSNRLPAIRFPDAIRPWQHVMDCLNGYLALVESMLNYSTLGEWNFGPEATSFRTVRELVEEFAALSGLTGEVWCLDQGISYKESSILNLDSTKSLKNLNWKNILTWQESIELTHEFYFEQSRSDFEMMKSQIDLFHSKAAQV